MRSLAFTIVLFLFGLAGVSTTASAEMAYDSKLACTLTKYANSEQSKRLTKDWIRPHQKHSIIRTKGAAYTYFSSHWTPMRGSVSLDEPKKVTWHYQYNQKTVRETVRVKYHFTWFPHTSKIAVRVTFPGYQSIETVWGTCTEKKIYETSRAYTSTPANPKNGTSSQLLAVPVSTNHWRLIGVSSNTKVFYHKFEDAVMIASKFKLTDKLKQRLQNGDKIPLNFGFKWHRESFTPLQYDFDLWQPDRVQFGRLGDLDAVIIRDKSVRPISQNNDKYLFVWLQDGDDGAWAWRRTQMP